MRSDELDLICRDAAHIGDELSFPDYTKAVVLRMINERYRPALAHELKTCAGGYGQQFDLVTCVPGQDLYPVPARAIGGTLIKVEIQVPGQTNWQKPLTKIESPDQWLYDRGAASVNQPQRFMVQDGFLELYPSPNAAYVLKRTFYIAPSKLVTSQSSLDGGDAAIRGRVDTINKALRQIQVNAIPLDQGATPVAITSNNQKIDIIRPSGTFALAMFSQPQTLSGNTFTLTSTDSMDRIQIGDFVRAEMQSDWPTSIADEFHSMWALRAAMKILQQGSEVTEETDLSNTYAADLEKLRQVLRPEVSTQAKRIPIVPMYARGGRSGFWGR